jgi:hypothetical protein
MSNKSLIHGKNGPASQNRPPFAHRAKAFLKRNCMPTLVDDIIRIRNLRRVGAEVGEKPYLKAVGKYVARIGASVGVQFGSTLTFGVLAWQTQAGAPSTNSLDNSSPVANAFAALVAGSIPPHQQAAAANIMLGADYVISAARIAVEQVLWRKYKVTPDFPGTVVSPLVVGAGEMIYKSAALANTPDDPTMRLAQGIKGVYGNLVRFAMVGVIALAGKIYDQEIRGQVSQKQQPPQ